MYLFASGPGQPFHRVRQELGVLEGRTVIDHERQGDKGFQTQIVGEA